MEKTLVGSFCFDLLLDNESKLRTKIGLHSLIPKPFHTIPPYFLHTIFHKYFLYDGIKFVRL